MLFIDTKEGKFFVGNVEIDLVPIYVGLETKIVVERKPTIPGSELVKRIVSDSYTKGINLFEANSYRMSILETAFKPQTVVQDGTVPAQISYSVCFDFYKAIPKKEITTVE